MQISALEVTCNAEKPFIFKSGESVIIREEGKEDQRIEPVDGFIEIEMSKNQKYKILF